MLRSTSQDVLRNALKCGEPYLLKRKETGATTRVDKAPGKEKWQRASLLKQERKGVQ